MRLIPFLTLVLLSLATAPVRAQTIPVDGGTVGSKEWNGSSLFRGIPFAAPPLGQLRWKPPQPVVPWRGVRGSVPQPASCLQNDYGWNHSDFLIGNEDCLTLDVRTPSLSGRLPVLVWIHGGSNRAGGPNDIVLSDVGKQVVIVGVRYRLGIFGFLSHRTLTAEQGASGNYGLMDQIAALRWVQRNIAKFGGDPGNVTIAGESAGSQDVSLLLAAPAARSLFQKAIMESGTPGFGMPFRSLGEAERIGEQASDLLGANGDLEKMRSASVPALLAVDKQVLDPETPGNDFVWLRTTIDGEILPASPPQLLEQAPPKPLIVGSNRYEWDVPNGRAYRDEFIARAFGANERAARELYQFDLPAPAPDPRLGSREGQLATDVGFRCPAIAFATLTASKGAPVWRYEFDAAPGGARTSHAAEIAYAFGDLTFGEGMALKPYWLNFIRSGDPNGPGLPAWPKFTPATPANVLFSDAGVTAGGALTPQSCALLGGL